MTSAADIRQEISKADDAIAAARDLIARGGSVDLSGLEQEVERLCGLIAGVDPSDRPSFEKPLIAMLDSVNSLAETARETRDQMQRQLSSISSHRQVLKVYDQSPSNRRPPRSDGSK